MSGPLAEPCHPLLDLCNSLHFHSVRDFQFPSNVFHVPIAPVLLDVMIALVIVMLARSQDASFRSPMHNYEAPCIGGTGSCCAPSDMRQSRDSF